MIVLLLVNGVVPLFFVGTLEARAVLIALAFGALLMEGLTWWQGFTRLLGLGHVLWLGLVPWLALRLPEQPAGAFKTWLAVVIACNTVSLILDVRDVALYLGGETRPGSTA